MQTHEHDGDDAEAARRLADEEQARLEVEARLRAAVRVLVIDNEVETADRVIAILERAGYAAEVAVDGASGISMAERFLPHLIILGPITHSAPSTEYARALRASAYDSGPDVPILHLVDRAHLLQQRFQSLSSTPLSEAIITPVEERELLDKVARALLRQ